MALEITCSLVTQVPTPEGSELERFVTVFVNDGRLKWRCHACRTKKDALGGTGRSLGCGRDPSGVANVLVHLANDSHASKVAGLQAHASPKHSPPTLEGPARNKPRLKSPPGRHAPAGGPTEGAVRARAPGERNASKNPTRNVDLQGLDSTQDCITQHCIRLPAGKGVDAHTAKELQPGRMPRARVDPSRKPSSPGHAGTPSKRLRTTPAAETRFVMLACPFSVRLCFPPTRIATARRGCAHARVPSVHGMRACHDERWGLGHSTMMNDSA